MKFDEARSQRRARTISASAAHPAMRLQRSLCWPSLKPPLPMVQPKCTSLLAVPDQGESRYSRVSFSMLLGWMRKRFTVL